MPYILSPPVTISIDGLWGEGTPYESKRIYSIEDGKLPPVNYSSHTLKPHSITHVESSAHVNKNGQTIDSYFKDLNYFYGPCSVIRLPGDRYTCVDPVKGIYHWIITRQEIEDGLKRIHADVRHQEKILITTDKYHVDTNGYHDSNYVLTLSQEAADYLIDLPNFNLYGTSWKSSDYSPGSPDRPIHKTLLKKAIIFELLDLKTVPEGTYNFVGLPIRLVGASESPVTPILFAKDEWP